MSGWVGATEAAQQELAKHDAAVIPYLQSLKLDLPILDTVEDVLSKIPPALMDVLDELSCAMNFLLEKIMSLLSSLISGLDNISSIELPANVEKLVDELGVTNGLMGSLGDLASAFSDPAKVVPALKKLFNGEIVSDLYGMKDKLFEISKAAPGVIEGLVGLKISLPFLSPLETLFGIDLSFSLEDALLYATAFSVHVLKAFYGLLEKFVKVLNKTPDEKNYICTFIVNKLA